MRIRHAQRRFSVTRDAAGVPQIRAGSWWDALYGLGYLHAVDRGTQMLFSRTVAGGQGAGKIADRDELFETDCFFRRIGLHLELDAEVSAMDQRTLDQVLVYCAGVNDGLTAKGRSLPIWVTGYEPRPWTPAAVVLVGRMLNFGGLAIGQLENEILLVKLIHAGVNDAALAELFGARVAHVDFELVRKIRMVNHLSDDALELLVDLPRLAGSNAWAVAPSRSATGHALLAGDPHLEVNRLPAIWYEAVLQWDDGYVMGATLPGMPLVSVGRNADLAWSVTYIKADTIDLFIEDCRRLPDGGWQYRRQERWHDFQVRQESIERKGQSPFDLTVLENDVGTLDDVPQENGLYLSVAWVGRRTHTAATIGTWLRLLSSRNVSQAMDIVTGCTQPTLCFVLADRQGHIGKQGGGNVPRRQNPQAGLVPLAAWDQANHWQGWLPVTVLPSEFDPPCGFVVSANEACNPPQGPWIVTQTVPDYRWRRIRDQLSKWPRATLRLMQQLQYDVVSTQAHDLLKVILPELPEGWLKDRLGAWDGSYDLENSTAPIFQQLYRYVMMEMLGSQRGVGWRRMLYLSSRAGFSTMILTAADQLLQRDQAWWWHGVDRGDVIRRAAARVVEQPGVRWGDVNQFHFANRFFGMHHVGRLLGYNSRSHGMPGCHATPFLGHVFCTARRESTFAPSYHFVTCLGSDQAWTNSTRWP